MTQSLNQITFKILSNLNIDSSDDSIVDIREIRYEVHNIRARFIRNDLDKSHTIDSNIIQDLGCIEMESVDRGHCCELKLGCNVMRTKQLIPIPIETHYGDGITRIASIDKLDKPYSYIEYERAIFAGNGRFNKNTVFAFMLNNRVYLTSGNAHRWMSGIQRINVRGVFANPEEVEAFKTLNGGDCYNNDMLYPVNSWMADAIINELTQKYSIRLGIPVDSTNDAKSDPKPSTTLTK